MSGLVFPLAGEQLPAAGPQDNVWLSASAGTGKTQVLSARVLRLLLEEGVEPSQLLCLTFTKAGAAEMANRINAVLARWVRLPATTLARELGYLGADISPATQARARSLFASVLDCPGGGLRIDTIHAFSQWLLANFPEEAGLIPGARAMEDRTRDLMARSVLADLLEEAEAAGDARLIGAVQRFTRRKSPTALQGWLMTCADAEELWDGPAGWQSPLGARVRRLLDMPADADEAWADAGLAPDAFPDGELRIMLPVLQGWKAQTGEACSAFIAEWLTLPQAQRAAAADHFYTTLLTKQGAPRSMPTPEKSDPEFPRRQQAVADALAAVNQRRALIAVAEYLTDALEIGRAFAVRWAAAKAREGLLDFSDLIRKAARLLGKEDASAWIRYKLDRRFDHILIDEAQDTNQAQWDIVLALVDDFFSGEGAQADHNRTIFTVGDYKQAIFGFQGTSPENFARAKAVVERRILAARENIAGGRINRRSPTWRALELDQSFRTAQPVLDFVNAAIAGLGHEAFGLDRPPRPHIGYAGPGLVTLWRPVTPGANAPDDDMPADDEPPAQDWLPHHDTLLASRIADQIARWVNGDEPFVLAKGGQQRRAGPGDIMVLVRRRKELASQIVAKLQARRVPVAGVDRLRLGAPLAVRDVLAALRFAVQPLDDLALANLLASPLIGWSQDDLLAHVPRGEHVRLWEHLRRRDAPSPPELVQHTAEKLRDLLRRTDYETPQALIAWLLNGSWQGRARLVERLGSEINDPLDELLNAAFAYESEHVPSLAGFLQWFDAGSGELKRDSDGGAGQVRVLTVHGSKGLQAPIVILADATGEPGETHNLALPDDPLRQNGERGERLRMVPLPPLAKVERVGPVAKAAEQAQIAALQEHWRLMYVAMTRAEEALFIGGSLSKQQDAKGPHADSWYARLAPLFAGEMVDDPLWLMRREWGTRAPPLAQPEIAPDAARGVELPRWALTAIGPEPRPPRPLAPSNAGEDRAVNPPLPPDAAKDAARRGSLIHRLLERLPDLPETERAATASAWLARQAGDLPEEARATMLASALAVLNHSDFAPLFSPQALAEVPLAATVGGIVVAGTVDRLLVTAESVLVVDFKTTRRPPCDAAAIPLVTLRQMAAYVAALEAIYPGRPVRAGVLYTHAPQLFVLEPAVIALHKQSLEAPQQTYLPPDIE